ncbi:WD repeat domain phosphoinositide-interacting protein 4-like [Coccinella septempunctata]|uniref:WD repeat domain phosphoinositide-interacting protein 4-like n=1 Tax=Coccinella septempunctata TaxID=41139 RepID=UPI001D079438|nr:WD repeat domain phosphoinositide-interacting protein 4-like [Coccinella septempunctata]XP_044761599.1 WD repeat domain phosphoinositide-interacting protein 4-like [Coccinella septempunctata]
MDRKILSLRFNQDHGLFSCSMEHGVRIYNVEPLCEKDNIDKSQIGSISMCEMAYRGNFLCMVAGGHYTKFPDSHLMVYDAKTHKFVLRIKFASSIRAVRMKRNKIAVSLSKQLFVYSFPEMKTLVTMDLRDNSRGLLEITPSARGGEREIIVFPGCRIGALQIVDITNTELAQSSTPASIECHTNELSCICLNQEGTKVATTSDQGTIIRIWDTTTTQQLLELRRGCEAAQIYSLCFDHASEFLCCSSDKGTVHIFAINDVKLNKQMLFGTFLGKFGGPLKSFATFQLPPECPCVCAFGSNNSVVAIGMDGSFNKYTFTIEGHCARVGYDVFIDLVGDFLG